MRNSTWNPEKAIQVYSISTPLLDIIEFQVPRALPTQSSFAQYRELWRWVERLILRAITLLARVRHLDDQEGLIWTFFVLKCSLTTYLPSHFFHAVLQQGPQRPIHSLPSAHPGQPHSQYHRSWQSNLRTWPSGIESLLRASVTSAAFDSIERYPVPACIPGIRLDLLARLAGWVDNPDVD
ncbi:hypothetical protein PAXINDRAFT_8095 [Paxillus involutus ATCC 200175]|nr:hypothetical protein PAXINDRAFT_8095 [Paxillus involutus ATCC 200175]